jgi:transcriptional regulator with XRE-family HTH domain
MKSDLPRNQALNVVEGEYDLLCRRIGNRIRELRKERGWTQLYITRNFNFYESHWRKIETGRTCSLQTLHKVAKMYGVSISELLQGVGSEEEDE